MASATTPSQEFAIPPTSLIRRATAAAAIGNATEWYDYGVYGYLAIELGHNFFPGPYSTLASLLTFAVSFLLRPLGGIVWGPLGDRLGRTRVLSITILLMAGCTFLIGLLPTYGSIGVIAPIALVVLRIVQGFSTGGEYGGAATFMAEYAPDKRRGFWGSFLEFGTISGLTVAVLIIAGLSNLLGETGMSAWGWRIPFLLALPLGAIGLYLRLRMEDTPVFRELEAADPPERQDNRPLRELFHIYWPQMLRLGGMVIGLNVTSYTLLSYVVTYVQTTGSISGAQAKTVVTVGQVCMLVVLPFVGILSDHIGRKPCWWVSFAGLFVLAVPMFLLLQGDIGMAIVGFVVLGLLYTLQIGTISATLPAMFPAHVRYSGMATSYNVATAALGGTAPFVAALLVQTTGNNLMPAFYMMAACVVGAIALVSVPETAGCSLRGTTIPRRMTNAAGTSDVSTNRPDAGLG